MPEAPPEKKRLGEEKNSRSFGRQWASLGSNFSTVKQVDAKNRGTNR
jgi:hypothetical protein